MTSLFVTLLTLLLLASAVIYVLLGYRLTFELARRGHRSPFHGAGMALYLTLGWAGALLLFCVSEPLVRGHAPFRPDMLPGAFANLGLLLLAPLLAWATAAVAFVRWVPRGRPRRQSGRRRVRFPWQAAGWALLVLYALVVVIGWKGAADHRSLMPLRPFMLVATAVLTCFYFARRSKAAGLDEVVALDPRPPVLYLRSFAREAETFVELSAKELAAYSAYTLNRTGATLEQYMSGALASQLGPLLALGSPEDYLPPEGAARAYAEDQAWQSQFAELSADAACIVMAVDESPNLRWELRWLRQTGLQTRLFVLTPPPSRHGWKFAAGRKTQAWYARANGLASRSWPAFVSMLGELDYQLAPADPAPASVVTFDEHGGEIRLSAGAGTPEEFVAVIAAQLAVVPESERTSDAIDEDAPVVDCVRG